MTIRIACFSVTVLFICRNGILTISLSVKKCGERLVNASLKMAIRSRSPQPGLINHTDRGGQYVSNEYKQILLRAAMRSSMSRADNCYDNAFAESCFGTIKNELQMTEYQNYQDAKRQLAEFIRYYNFERTHSSIGYLTPHQFELNISSKK